MTDVSGINMLIDDLKNEDITQRMFSLKRLSTIAVALGPERTRSELVPFLKDSIDHEDEVLIVMAEEIGNLIPYMGGGDKLECLIDPLEEIAKMEETIVRDVAVQSMVKVCEELPASISEGRFLKAVQQLAIGEWFTAKISAAGLLAVAYKKVGSDSAKTELVGMFEKLCGDDSPMVRRAISTNIPDFAKAVDMGTLTETVIPCFLKLSEDEQDSVRLLSVHNCVAIGQLLGSAEAATSVLPTFKACATAKSWRVRYMCADQLVDLCETLEQDVIQEELVDVFLDLLQVRSEFEAEVRTAAARRLTGVAKLLPQEVVMTKIIAAVEDCHTDPSQHVRSALASVIMGLAPVCGEESTKTKLLPMYKTLLKDAVPEVRLNIISNLADVCAVIGVESMAQELLPAVMELSRDEQWRVRLAIIEYLPLLAEQMGVGLFDDKLSAVTFAWLGDPVFAVRDTAIQNLRQLGVLFGVEWADAHMVPKVIELKDHTNYLHRLTTLFCISALADVVSPDALTNQLTPVAIELTKDSIPNVKFNACKTLQAIAAQTGAADAITEALQKLQKDEDIDVADFSTQALTAVAAQ